MTTAPEVDRVDPVDPTRAALLAAARLSLIEDGHAGTTVHTIADRAGLDAGLVAEHFGDLDALLAETSRVFARERAVVWQGRLARCATLTEVVGEARGLLATERQLGSPVMLGQLLARARGSEAITASVTENFHLHVRIVETAIVRVLDGTPLEDALDAHGLARSVAAGFIGLELVGAVVDGGDDLLDQLEVLARLTDEVLGAGLVTGAWLRRRIGDGGPRPE